MAILRTLCGAERKVVEDQVQRFERRIKAVLFKNHPQWNAIAKEDDFSVQEVVTKTRVFIWQGEMKDGEPVYEEQWED